MAGAQCATTISFLPPFSTTSSPSHRKPVVSISSISPPFPSKPTRRKNHLRLKLLKTLKIPKPTPTNPVIPSESRHEQQPDGQIAAGEETNESETREFQISETSETAIARSGDFGNFSTRSVFKLGLYLVGAFVFQTICAVLVFGSVDSEEKDGNLDSGIKTRALGISVSGKNEAKLGVSLNGSGNSFGFEQGGIGSELDEKIVEIQEMARIARESERLSAKVSGLENEDDDIKTGIEQEVDSKLVKLRKMWQKSSEKSSVFPVNLRKDGEIENEVNKPLMFKKKYKFRSPSVNVSDKPKGFVRSEDGSITKNRKNNSVIEDEDETITNGNLPLDHTDGNSQSSVSLPLEEDGERKPSKEKSKSFQNPRKKLGNERAKAKPGKGNGATKPERGIGATQENGLGRPLVKAARSRKLTSKRAAAKVEDKRSEDEADLWWSSLPYVLAILMGRGDDGEGPKGLFTLKTTPYLNDDGGSSRIVAFEDRGDATNFCYLLQSFFEDLGDFSAEIVPMSIKELDEEVSSDTRKVIVVKKGQLKLYAGQPLAEVEMALRSLVK